MIVPCVFIILPILLLNLKFIKALDDESVDQPINDTVKITVNQQTSNDPPDWQPPQVAAQKRHNAPYTSQGPPGSKSNSPPNYPQPVAPSQTYQLQPNSQPQQPAIAYNVGSNDQPINDAVNIAVHQKTSKDLPNWPPPQFAAQKPHNVPYTSQGPPGSKSNSPPNYPQPVAPSQTYQLQPNSQPQQPAIAYDVGSNDQPINDAVNIAVHQKTSKDLPNWQPPQFSAQKPQNVPYTSQGPPGSKSNSPPNYPQPVAPSQTYQLPPNSQPQQPAIAYDVGSNDQPINDAVNIAVHQKTSKGLPNWQLPQFAAQKLHNVPYTLLGPIGSKSNPPPNYPQHVAPSQIYQLPPNFQPQQPAIALDVESNDQPINDGVNIAVHQQKSNGPPNWQPPQFTAQKPRNIPYTLHRPPGSKFNPPPNYPQPVAPSQIYQLPPNSQPQQPAIAQDVESNGQPINDAVNIAVHQQTSNGVPNRQPPQFAAQKTPKVLYTSEGRPGSKSNPPPSYPQPVAPSQMYQPNYQPQQPAIAPGYPVYSPEQYTAPLPNFYHPPQYQPPYQQLYQQPLQQRYQPPQQHNNPLFQQPYPQSPQQWYRGSKPNQTYYKKFGER